MDGDQATREFNAGYHAGRLAGLRESEPERHRLGALRIGLQVLLGMEPIGSVPSDGDLLKAVADRVREVRQ